MEVACCATFISHLLCMNAVKHVDVISRKYGVLTAMLLCYVAEFDTEHWNIDKIYSVWRKNKPSRSTFSQILSEMEALNWIDKELGAKKSEVYIFVDRAKIIAEVGLLPEFGKSPGKE